MGQDPFWNQKGAVSAEFCIWFTGLLILSVRNMKLWVRNGRPLVLLPPHMQVSQRLNNTHHTERPPPKLRISSSASILNSNSSRPLWYWLRDGEEESRESLDEAQLCSVVACKIYICMRRYQNLKPLSVSVYCGRMRENSDGNKYRLIFMQNLHGGTRIWSAHGLFSDKGWVELSTLTRPDFAR